MASEEADALNIACLNGTCGCGPWTGCKVAESVWTERDQSPSEGVASKPDDTGEASKPKARATELKPIEPQDSGVAAADPYADRGVSSADLKCATCKAPAVAMAHAEKTDGGFLDWPVCEAHFVPAILAGWKPVHFDNAHPLPSTASAAANQKTPEHDGYGRCSGTGRVWVDDGDKSNFYRGGSCPNCQPPEVKPPVVGEGETCEWFWRIVDAHGLADLPSDEESALRLLVDRASTSPREAGLREAIARIIDPWAWTLLDHPVKYSNPFDQTNATNRREATLAKADQIAALSVQRSES